MSQKTDFPYIPNSVPEIQEEMLREVGASDVMDLYEEIPEELRVKGMLNLPEPIRDELGSSAILRRYWRKNKNCNEYDNFMGAGCAQHYVPAVCDEIAGRGELLTCYGAETLGGSWQIPDLLRVSEYDGRTSGDGFPDGSLPLRPGHKYLLIRSRRPVIFGIGDSPFFRRQRRKQNGLAGLYPLRISVLAMPSTIAAAALSSWNPLK